MMNPLPNIDFPSSAPIPHQFAMKVYVDTWICITEKFGNMGFIEAYEGILRYGKFRYPTIPNFIYSHFSFISNGFLNWGDGVYTIFTPSYANSVSNCCTALFMDSSVTWTYRSIVVLMLLCPSSFCRTLGWIPLSIARVA